MDIFNKLNDAHNIQVREEEKKRGRYLEESKKKIQKIISTKMRTCFVGGLSSVEHFFGSIWGHNSTDPLTPEQEKMKEIWEECRTAILNNGNTQLRALESELLQYTINWNRYQKNLKPENGNGS